MGEDTIVLKKLEPQGIVVIGTVLSILEKSVLPLGGEKVSTGSQRAEVARRGCMEAS